MKSSPLLARHLRQALLSAAGCLTLGVFTVSCQDPVACQDNSASTLVVDRLRTGSLDKIDILLAVDNSRSMADKQQILALAVPDLVLGLANPPCFNPDTGEVAAQPATPLDQCPDGTERQSTPIFDIHIGVVTSSLGGHGSDACSTAGAGKQSNNDKGHLIARLDPTMPTEVETYQNLKFLAWDPQQMLTPPGEADIDADSAADANSSALVPALRDMVIGAGQVGCGYESQLESWYRFLIDPTPPEEVTLDAQGKVLLQGIDTTLLDQRKTFLRPDSLLAIIMLTDENDCSIREQGQFYFAAQQKAGNGSPFHLPKAREICATNPNDQCCFSCGQSGPKDDNGDPLCGDDPTCKTPDNKTVYLDELADNINLRCWDQKRRFGIDFLYPTDRYVDALQSQTVTDRTGQVVPNPIFTDLDQSDGIGNVRTTNLVFLAGIVGVPWQDIARTNNNGVPDLANGVDPEGKARGGFKNADEMIALLPGKDYNTWDLILGDLDKYPAADALPWDPLMIESVDMRAGINPITGDSLVPSSMPLGNKLNGHEWTISKRDDLQFACIFPLPVPQDCAAPGVASCDCEDDTNDSPLCTVDPTTQLPNIQSYAKAYPGLRELQVLKRAGSQGIVGSVCPAQQNDPSRADFGYRPAINAILDRLTPTASGGGCFGRKLQADEAGQVPCLVVEARAVPSDQAGQCNACLADGRDPISAEQQDAIEAIGGQEAALSYNCFCEIPQLAHTGEGDPLSACQNDPSDALPAGGYCYIDSSAGIGNPELTQNCPANDRRLLRFVGAGAAQSGATVYIVCNDEQKVGSTSCEASEQ